MLVGLLVPEDEAAVDVPLLHLEGHDVQVLQIYAIGKSAWKSLYRRQTFFCTANFLFFVQSFSKCMALKPCMFIVHCKLSGETKLKHYI